MSAPQLPMTKERILARATLGETRPHMDTPCLEWQGARANGYGVIGWGGTSEFVHRAMYRAEVGVIPKKLQINHLCDNRACCRLDHLYLGTHAQNMRDTSTRGTASEGQLRRRARDPSTWCVGNQVPTSRLTETQVYEIRRRADAGESYRPLSVEFDVSWNAIRLIALRRNWRHLKEQPCS
jgi:hypothetical protein